MIINDQNNLPAILFITTFPPRECGIATYSQDLIRALHNKFEDSFTIPVCALESESEIHSYPDEVSYVLDTTDPASFIRISDEINRNEQIRIVMVQHEFGFFDPGREADLLLFLKEIQKPVILTFHTVLPRPDAVLRSKVEKIAACCSSIVVMTQNAAAILTGDYQIAADKITVIPHGIHLVPHADKNTLKKKYGIAGHRVLSTFGLISSGKSIETTIEALPAVVKEHPDVLFLAIGKTHPTVVRREGEAYRKMLEDKVKELDLEQHVRFINAYLPLNELLEYLQLTDIYLFTSRDPNQAVSGTFSYAISCACPIISTPIPHAKEVLSDDAGLIVDFQNSEQLSKAVNLLLDNEPLRTMYSYNGLQKIESAAWENVAVTYAALFQKMAGDISFRFRVPELNLGHIKKLTTRFGMIQFSKINRPDISSGYTIDDNARALVALIMHYKQTSEEDDLPYIATYLNFIAFCQQPDGAFLNYVDENRDFTDQNNEVNLEDANGRAIWALGFLIAESVRLPAQLTAIAQSAFSRALPGICAMHSPRAIAFALKGLYYFNMHSGSPEIIKQSVLLADRLAAMYQHEGELRWEWFESYLTYGNSILPEAMLCAGMLTGNPVYKEIAQASFAFLLDQTFSENGIKVISNQNWLQKGLKAAAFGEQPIDVAYTVLALDSFYTVFKDSRYLDKLYTAFNWFMGHNHLNQIIYNPCTGGCYDGLEQHRVNLNQGAESTVTYLMARLTMERYIDYIPDSGFDLAGDIPEISGHA